MNIPRVIHTATLLADGQVLVTGGATTGGIPTATAELYDPATGIWSLTGSMAEARTRHTATLLLDGRVLVSGGRSRQGVSMHTAELFDPATGSWTQTGDLRDARTWATATRLTDGRVLVTGGLSDDSIYGFANNTAELYDPGTGLWTMVDHMANARYGHRAVLLSDGRVLVSGGSGQEGDCIYKVTAEIYNPQTNRWSNTTPMFTARGFQAATLLQDGHVLVIGGLTLPAVCSPVSAASEVYDTSTNRWRPVGNLVTPRGFLADAAVLPDGRVLIAGGRTNPGITASAELFNPVSGNWDVTASMISSRVGHTLTVLLDGQVLATGGDMGRGVILNSAELYTPD